jgi:hypothetical protein
VLAAHLAGGALEAYRELQHMPGIDTPAFDPPSAFWQTLRDYNAGKNDSLPPFTPLLFQAGNPGAVR